MLKIKTKVIALTKNVFFFFVFFLTFIVEAPQEPLQNVETFNIFRQQYRRRKMLKPKNFNIFRSFNIFRCTMPLN